MTNVQAPCETDQTWLTTPIIQINGERLDEGGTTECLRNRYSALRNPVVTACDSGRTPEEGTKACREHEEARVNELQELMKDCSLADRN